MPQLTLIAGMRGTGKTTLLDDYSSLATVVDAEIVQGKAVEAVEAVRGNGFKALNSWRSWDADLRAQAEERLKSSLQTLRPKIKTNGGNFLASGSLLVKDWYRIPFVKALEYVFDIRFQDIRYCILHFEETIILEQIVKRGKRREVFYFENEYTVKKERDGYWGLAVKSCVPWEKICNHETMRDVVEGRI